MTVFSQAFTLSATSNASIATPPQAVAAGFNTLAFNDDFTTTTTISSASNASVADGHNWYWGTDVSDTSYYAVNTALTAATLQNGNTSGGPNASPLGGILTINKSDDNNNGQLMTIPNHINSLANTGPNLFQHCYMEAYIQLNHAGTSVQGPPAGPQFSTWPVQNLLKQNTDSLHEPETTQIYIMWYYQPAGGYSTLMTDYPASPGTGYTNTPVNGPSISTSNNAIWNMDDEWHTYGCLWTLVSGTPGTANAVGNVKFYRDNIQCSYPGGANPNGVATGLGSPLGMVALEQANIYLALGTGTGFPINVDWVRVWTA